jgi:hypothetical protein
MPLRKLNLSDVSYRGHELPDIQSQKSRYSGIFENAWMIKTSEIELLLRCSRVRMDSENADKISQLLQQNLDWDWLLKAASFHGIIPQLYLNLKTLCPEAVPKNILSRLQINFLYISKKNRVMTKELLYINNVFLENNIEAVPFKGPVLSLLAYGDITSRQFSDLDIMIKKRNVLKVKPLMSARGYQLKYKFPPFQERLRIQGNREFVFVRNDLDIMVEVHWAFHPKVYSVKFDEGVWSRLKTASIEGTQLSTFSTEDLVLALCAHGMRHHWPQMKLVNDFARMISLHELNWEQLNSRAEDLGLKRILHISFYLAHDLLNIRFPKELFYDIAKDTSARKLAAQLSNMLFNNSGRDDAVVEPNLLWMRSRDGLRNNARSLWIGAFESTTADWEAVPLPEEFYPFYRVIRPVRLLFRYGLGKI